MNLIITAATLALTVASATAAESRIHTLCGADHQNEATGPLDVRANPDGYYITATGEQLSHGDPRIIQATGEEFHYCTRSAATPDMDATRARLMMEERVVKYLFVPVFPAPKDPLS